MIRRSTNLTENFTVVSNHPITDETLSWEARGMLVYLLSKPTDWTVHPKQLVNESPSAGRDRVYRILNELVEAGYIRRMQGRSENGQLADVEYVVFDVAKEPNPNDLAGSTVSGFAVYGSAVSGSAVSGKHGRIERTDSNKELRVQRTDLTNSCSSAEAEEPVSEISEESIPSSAKASRGTKPKNQDHPDFESVWALYPRKVSRGTASKQFSLRLREGVSTEELRQATTNYASVVAGREPKFILHGQTFYGPNERWRDYLDDGAGMSEAVQGATSNPNHDILAQFLEGEDW